jgi:hypothetical protein
MQLTNIWQHLNAQNCKIAYKIYKSRPLGKLLVFYCGTKSDMLLAYEIITIKKKGV